MDEMYYGQPSMNNVDCNGDQEQIYDRDDRDWRRSRRHRSRSPYDRGSSRQERSRSRERDRYDRYDRSSPYRGERDDNKNRDYENRLAPSATIEYHHGLSEEKTRASFSDSRNSRSDRWQKELPSQTIFLGGVPRFIEEPDIRAELEQSGIMYSDVRMVRNKETGANRGFAFVEFRSIDDARQWMDLNQGLLKVRDTYGVPHTVTMDYSKASSPVVRQPQAAPPLGRPPAPSTRQSRPPEITEWRINDWKCNRCGCDNFRRRENCFQCNIPRSEGERSLSKDDDGYDQVGSNPCNTLLLRGLDALTSEPSIVNSIAMVSAINPKNVCVARNSLTGLSRGYAVVECASIRESSLLLDTFNNLGSPFEVDGKAIIVSFARNTYSTFMAYMAQQSAGPHHAGSAEAYDNGGYSQRVGPTSRPGPLRHVVDPSNAAEVAEAALLASRMQQQQELTEHVSADLNQSTLQSNVISPPDVNTFVFDDSSGYYYDANTGYYYDANTQYFYSPQVSQFLYWDSATQSYLPAPTSTTEPVDNSTSSNVANAAENSLPPTAAEQAAEKVKVERAKNAKKIVKDMERWAKVQNANKESSGGGFKKPMAPISVPSAHLSKKESATADAGFAAAVSKATKSDKFTIELTRGREERRPFGKVSEDAKAKAKAQIVASYGGDSESDDETEEPPPVRTQPEEMDLSSIEAKMTDWDKLTCLLCKRLFNTKDVLLRHQQLSDLHKSNLEELKKSMMVSKGR